MRQTRKRVRNNRPTMSSDSEFKKLVTIVIIVLVICIVFYLMAILVNNKKAKPAPTTIQYSEIIVGTLLNQKDKTYYVLAFNPKDTNVETYKTALEAKSKTKHYTLDLSSTFNSKYLTEEENFDFDQISDIQFKETTLLKIEKNKITAHYTGEDISKTIDELSE